MLEAFRRDGGLIVDGMFNRATIDAMTARPTDALPEFPPGSATQGMGAAGAAFVGANTVRFSSLPLLDDAYFDMLDNEIFAAIADAVLLPTAGRTGSTPGRSCTSGPARRPKSCTVTPIIGGSTCAQPGPTWSTSRSAP